MEFIYDKTFQNLPVDLTLPETFELHVKDKAVKYFIYNCKLKKGRCTSCGELVQYGIPSDKKQMERTVYDLGAIKRHAFVICPMCGEQLIAYPDSFGFVRLTSNLHMWVEDESICYAISCCRFSHDKGFEFGSYDLHLVKVGKMSRKNQQHYIFLYGLGGELWHRKDAGIMYDANFFLSQEEKKVIRGALSESCLEHYDVFNCGMPDSCKKVLKLIAWNVKYPQAEYLQRAGLYKLCTDAAYGEPNFIRPDWSKNTVAGILRLSPQSVDKLKAWDMLDVANILICQKLERENQKITKNLMQLCKSVVSFRGVIEPYFFGEKFKGIKLSRYCRYIRKQYEDHAPCCSHGFSGYSMCSVSGVWRDYYNMLKQLDYPINDYYLYPKNLKEAHDRLADEVNRVKVEEWARENAERVQAFEKHLAVLEKLAYEDSGYIIRPLRNYEEFLAEGKLQRNCVATYWDRAASGKTAIFVIRTKDEPDNPLATVELNKGKVAQCRGFQNRDVADEVKAFCKYWEQHIVNKKKEVS